MAPIWVVVSAATCVLFMALKSEVYSALIWSVVKAAIWLVVIPVMMELIKRSILFQVFRRGKQSVPIHISSEILRKVSPEDQNSRKASIEVNRRLLIDMLISFPWFWVNPPLISTFFSKFRAQIRPCRSSFRLEHDNLPI